MERKSDIYQKVRDRFDAAYDTAPDGEEAQALAERLIEIQDYRNNLNFEYVDRCDINREYT